MKKRILYIIFAIFLVTSNVAEVHAEAGVLTIIGGSIATGGLTGEALVSAVVPYMAPVLLGIMIAGGLNVYLTEQSQAVGMTKTEYLTNKVREYCDAAGKPIDKFWGDFANGCTVAQNGTIAIGEQARTQVKQFINWLESQNEIYDGTNIGSSDSTVVLNGNTFPVLSRGESISLGGGVTFTYVSGDVQIGLFIRQYSGIHMQLEIFTIRGNSEPTIVYNIGNGNVSKNLNYTGNGYRWNAVDFDCAVGNLNGEIPFFGEATPNQVIYSFDGSFNVVSGGQAPTQDTVIDTTGNGVGVTDNALSPSAGTTPVLNPGLTDGIDLEGLAGVTSTVQEYLDALRDVLDGIRDPAITGEREDTGEKDTIAIDEDDVADPVIDPVLDPDLPPVETPVVDPNSQPTGENAVKPLTMDLKTVFPFCLPFDAYKMLQKLNASAVAPNYQVNWYIPIVNQTLSFTVDLSSFNSVAEVLRNLELIAFCIGLAIVTRNIIRS